MNSSKPSMLKQSRFVSGSDTMNRGRWSDMGGWAGGGVSDCDRGKRRKREGRERGEREDIQERTNILLSNSTLNGVSIPNT